MRGRFGIVIAAAVGLAGCVVSLSIRPEYFDGGQRAALVLLHAYGKVFPEPVEMHAPGQAMPILPGGRELDAAPILEAIHPVIVEALGRSAHFRLVPEERVLSTPSYQAFPSRPPRGGYIVPRGYKWITSDSAFPPIVRESGAEMGLGILVNLYYGRADGSARMNVWIGIVGADGKGVWKRSFFTAADRPVNLLSATEKERIAAFRELTRATMAEVEAAMTEELAAARGGTRAGR